MERWLLGSDFHIPFNNVRMTQMFFDIQKWFKPDYIDILGDLDDACPVSRFADGMPVELSDAVYTYAPLVQNFFKELRGNSNDADIHYATGNHECLDIRDHRVVTIGGFKSLAQLEVGMLVLSVDDDGNRKWVPIQKVHTYSGPTKVYSIQRQSVRGRFTANHRMLVKTRYGSDTFVEKTMMDFSKTWGGIFRTATNNPDGDCDISDDSIRLLAWCLTDSHVSKSGRQWVFYQSAPKEDRIRQLLKSLGIAFSEKKRQRDTSEICGKRLSRPPNVSFEFTASVRNIEWDVDCRNNVPAIAAQFSQRQAYIFIQELQYTDGTAPTGGGSSNIIYCSDETKRHQIMTLCLQNGMSVSEHEYSSGYWRINVQHRDVSKVELSRGVPVTEETAEDGVFCITVETGRFFMEHGGRVHLTGNSRYDVYVSSKAPALVNLITPELLWNTETNGVQLSYYNNPPHERFENFYVHHGPYAVSKGGESVRKVMDDFQISCVVGHSHRQAYVAKSYPLPGITLRGWELGHFTDIDSSGMSYDRKHDWQAGFGIAHIENGYPHIQLIHINSDYECVVDGHLFKG